MENILVYRTRKGTCKPGEFPFPNFYGRVSQAGPVHDHWRQTPVTQKSGHAALNSSTITHLVVCEGEAVPYSIVGSSSDFFRVMKRFEELFAELTDKVDREAPDSGTVQAVQEGRHAIGKKVIEEAGEVWMAAEHEGPGRTAEEISQLLYHLQVLMIACDLDLEDVYEHL